jgi:predicted DNA-binding protein
MKRTKQETSTSVQYPLRLNYELHQRFRFISQKTKVPMSVLGRLGLTRFIDDIETRGITTILTELENYYE